VIGREGAVIRGLTEGDGKQIDIEGRTAPSSIDSVRIRGLGLVGGGGGGRTGGARPSGASWKLNGTPTPPQQQQTNPPPNPNPPPTPPEVRGSEKGYYDPPGTPPCLGPHPNHTGAHPRRLGGGGGGGGGGSIRAIVQGGGGGGGWGEILPGARRLAATSGDRQTKRWLNRSGFEEGQQVKSRDRGRREGAGSPLR